MAKAQGIIGNFKGKVGNMVGYQLTDSNNKQTQGIRIYQPNVKNPKTSAQAEQRAKLAPINATYRALKMVIDRGYEGLPYGNKSRLAWLKSVMTSFSAPWFEKGASINVPVLCPLTKGSLTGVPQPTISDGAVSLALTYTEGSEPTTVGALSTLLLSKYANLRNGDQLTFVTVGQMSNGMPVQVDSIVIDTASTEAISANFLLEDGAIIHSTLSGTNMAGAIIISREGDNGEHLRSTTSLQKLEEYDNSHDNETAKASAIQSYRASGAANTDWAEEVIQ